MCLKENYSDSQSDEYSRHYSAGSESEYLRRQNMNPKLGEEQKKKIITSVGVLISTQIRIKSKKKGQNDNGLILGRVSINSRPRHISSYDKIDVN